MHKSLEIFVKILILYSISIDLLKIKIYLSVYEIDTRI